MSKPKKSLLIIDFHQFGYLTISYKICQYLSGEYDITVVCWDCGRPKVSLPRIEIVYVPRKSNVFARKISLFSKYYEYLKRGYDLHYAVYQKGISLLKMISGKSIILDVPTLSVVSPASRRFAEDRILKLESLFFPQKMILSHELAKKIGFRKYHYVPLGSDRICGTKKEISGMSFLYVGVLSGRRLIQFIVGFEKFLMAEKPLEEIRFDIVGDGFKNELREITEYVENSHWLRDKVTCHGWVPMDRLEPFFSGSSIGVSYVPMTPWFDYQPPTKTIEYLLSDMVVIATKTKAHSVFTNDENFSFIEDNPEAVADAISGMYRKFQAGRLVFKPKDYSKLEWKNIIRNDFERVLEKQIV